MTSRLRPLFEGRLALRNFSAAVAVAAATAACSSSTETSVVDADQKAGDAMMAPSADESQAEACAPNVSGLVPAGIEPIEIACPRGYTQRASFAALPIAGRFTSAAELTQAFCIAKSAASTELADPRAPTSESRIDFEKSDVVAYAFDARAGVEPALYKRGAELWLRVTTTSCSSDPPVLASVAFVVPKAQKINEQKCAVRCE